MISSWAYKTQLSLLNSNGHCKYSLQSSNLQCYRLFVAMVVPRSRHPYWFWQLSLSSLMESGGGGGGYHARLECSTRFDHKLRVRVLPLWETLCPVPKVRCPAEINNYKPVARTSWRHWSGCSFAWGVEQTLCRTLCSLHSRIAPCSPRILTRCIRWTCADHILGFFKCIINHPGPPAEDWRGGGGVIPHFPGLGN